MENKCKDACPEKDMAMIPFFAAENQMMHADLANKRMLHAIIAICIMCVLMTSIFVVGYTIREKDRIDTIARMVSVLEVQDGVHQQPYP